MKKLILFMFIALAFTACKKIDEDNAKPSEVEVAFTVSEDDGLKVLPAECPEDENGDVYEPAYAKINILFSGEVDTTTYMAEVFYVNGMLYTQSLKLPVDDPDNPTEYTVTDFLLYDETQQIIIRATPHEDADYAGYVTQTVPFTFVVNAFEKAEVGVDVICYRPEVHFLFGFNWFGITEYELREKCFFGDICLNGEPYTPADFEGSAYGTDLAVDVPAIMQIIVKNGEDTIPVQHIFTNLDGNLTAPLCVQYPDNLNVEGEEFTFELQLWLPDEDGIFNWQTYEVYEATDAGAMVAQSDGNIDTGDDNVLDFVVGTCGYPGMADQEFGFLGTETAYAYIDDVNVPCDCFLNLDIGNNWGWQIGAFSGDQTFELWAAAGGCNLNNGTEVGYLVVNFDDSGKLVDVEYVMNSPYTLEEVQLYISILPWSGNNIAPGQFPYKVDGLGGVTSYIFSDTDLPDLTGDVYVIAHAVVIGF